MPSLEDYDISKTATWPGLAKLVEEMAELTAELMRLVAIGGREDVDHWDGKGKLDARILSEMADVQAALSFFLDRNFNSPTEVSAFAARVTKKIERFKDWMKSQ